MSYGAHWGSERPSPWGRELGTTTMSNLSWLLGNPSRFKPWSHRVDRDGKATPCRRESCAEDRPILAPPMWRFASIECTIRGLPLLLDERLEMQAPNGEDSPPGRWP